MPEAKDLFFPPLSQFDVKIRWIVPLDQLLTSMAAESSFPKSLPSAWGTLPFCTIITVFSVPHGERLYS